MRSNLLAAVAVIALAGALAPIVAVAPASAAGSVSISTRAGGIGWGAKATVAQRPERAILGPDNKVYVADSFFNVVRRIDPANGDEQVVVGTGAIGHSGDNGPAGSATLGFRLVDGSSDPPPGLTFDSAGNLYIADTNNHVVRKVAKDANDTISPASTITRFAGTGVAGSADGNVTTAQLNLPSGVAFDGSGSLHIADAGNNKIRRIVTAFNEMTTLVGTGLSTPTDVEFDGAGNLYIADRGNCQVKRLSGGTVSTYAGSSCGFADNASPTSAQFRQLNDMALDTNGDLYVADTANCLVRKVASGPGAVTTVGGLTTGAPACGYDGDGAITNKLNRPRGIARFNATTWLVADTDNFRVRSLTSSALQTYAGTGYERYGGDGGATEASQLNLPTGVAVAPDGTVYFSDTANHVVRKIAAGGTITRYAGTGVAGYSTGTDNQAATAQLKSPRGLAVDDDGNLFIADEGNCVIRRVNAANGTISVFAGVAPTGAPPGTPQCGTSGELVTATTAMLDRPQGVAAFGADVYIADTENHVARLVRGGLIKTIAGVMDTSGSQPTRLNTPRGIGTGPDGAVYIADTLNHRIQKVVIDENDVVTVSTFAGTGTAGLDGDGDNATDALLRMPYAVAGAADGAVYIADTFNHRIRKVAGGTIDTFAGSSQGLSGDGGSPAFAKLNTPQGVATGGDQVYVGDSLNDRLRRIGPPPTPPATVPGAPSNVTATPGDRQVVIGWTAPDDGGSPLTKYKVRAYQGAAEVASIDGGAQFLSTTISGLTNGAQYTFTVTAENAIGVGPASAASGVVIPRTVPGPPVNVDAGSDEDLAGVIWEAPVDNGGAPITSYLVTVLQDGVPVWAGSFGSDIRLVIVMGLPPGTYTFTVAAANVAGIGTAAASGPVTVSAPAAPGGPTATGKSGYWMLGSTGNVFGFGDAKAVGNAGVGQAVAVDIEPTFSGNGYWVLDEQGHVFTFGDAPYLGGADALQPGETATSISATPSGNGYRIFTNRGRAIVRGDAAHLGDMSAVKLNGPVLDSTTTPSGNGYYMVASDGGVFTFGDAVFRGSMGDTKLNQPVQSLVSDPDGTGYWLVASDGGIFSFEAPFYGSMGGTKLNKPVTGMVSYGKGYLMVAEDGGIFSFGEAPFHGSLGGNPPPYPITSVAVLR